MMLALFQIHSFPFNLLTDPTHFQGDGHLMESEFCWRIYYVYDPLPVDTLSVVTRCGTVILFYFY